MTLQANKLDAITLQVFAKSKDARILTINNLKAFLSFLAVEKKVAASSKNQAFNALLFFNVSVCNAVMEAVAFCNAIGSLGSLWIAIHSDPYA